MDFETGLNFLKTRLEQEEQAVNNLQAVIAISPAYQELKQREGAIVVLREEINKIELSKELQEQAGEEKDEN